MKKLDLEFAGWLWAINRGKASEYYADHYGGKVIKFTKEIGGQIVRQFFFDSEQLLQLAYRHLAFDWNIMLWSIYPDTTKTFIYKTKETLDFNDFSWLLFRSLAHSLEKKVITKLVEGDWLTLWETLDATYCKEDINEGESE